MEQPTGTLTFLFADIQGNTSLWEHTMRRTFLRRPEIQSMLGESWAGL